MSSLVAIAASNNILIGPNGNQFTNNNNIPKELAIFAIYHSAQYDGKPSDKYNLSVSDFLTPMRKLIYKIQNPDIGSTAPIDVAQIMKSAKGTSLHTGMETALEWYGSYKQEIRSEKQLLGVNISGKFDMIDLETNILKDLKHVSNFAYKRLQEDIKNLVNIDGTMSLKDKFSYIPTYTKFQFQLSAYHWLNSELNLEPYGDIVFALNDGGGMERYPIDVMHRFPLLLGEEVEEYILNHIATLHRHLDNGTLPLCSDEERGYAPGTWKLQRMGSTGKMATVRGSKCNSAAELANFIATKGRSGDVESITEPKYRLCDYCNVKSVCDQV